MKIQQLKLAQPLYQEDKLKKNQIRGNEIKAQLWESKIDLF